MKQLQQAFHDNEALNDHLQEEVIRLWNMPISQDCIPRIENHLAVDGEAFHVQDIDL